MEKKRGKRIMLYILLVAVIVFGFTLTKFIVETHTPVKYAIRLEDIHEYSNFILVRQTWHTGTGWERVGDEQGLYENLSVVRDVQLEGNLPPLTGIGGEHVNVFLCIVTPTGTYRIEGTTSPIYEYESFEVNDWYPIYPVKRDTIFPSWFYSKYYMSKADLKK